MTPDDIAKHRLANQCLLSAAATPKEVVSHMGAIQAQDYAMAKWAIGIRSNVTDKEVEAAINNGDILRTHILRPTWHFVSADDIGWMLAVTAPHVKTINNAMCRRYELDTKALNHSNAIIEKALSGGAHLTREEIMLLLSKKGIPTDDIRSTLIMMNAELDGIVCNGTWRGKQFTYSLLDLSNTKTLSKEEGLAELAKRYFVSHGPATLPDFAWWSGLSLTNSRAALEAVKSVLQSEAVAGVTYWFSHAGLPENNTTDHIHFLPAFDELIISYKDRSATVTTADSKQVQTNNGIFKPMIVINGKVAGIWKRTFKKEIVTIETQFFNKIGKLQKQAIFNAAQLYGRFVGMETVIK